MRQRSLNHTPAMQRMEDIPVKDCPKRVVVIGLGETGAEAVLDIYGAVSATKKIFLILSTNADSVKAIKTDPRFQSRGSAVHLPIPDFLAEKPVDGQGLDQFAGLRPFAFPEKAYSPDIRWDTTRQEGYIAFAASIARIEAALMEVIQSVGRRLPGEDMVVVYVLIVLFSGRGTGSGGLPVLLPSIERVTKILSASLEIRVLGAVQLPTVHVTDFNDYAQRSVCLLSELTAAHECCVEVAPDRRLGESTQLPWSQMLVFGESPARAGVEMDVDQARRYLGFVLKTRLDSTITPVIEAELPRRRHALDSKGFGGLPSIFSSMGAAELRLEPDAAIRVGEKLLWLRFLGALAGTGE